MSARRARMTLMAGPIDTRVNPTKVNELANSKPISWFEQNLIATVPFRYKGGMRQVYPGFVQLAAFMAMNIDRHVKAHKELYENIAKGEIEKAEATRTFYDEYFAVLDLTAEFYLETVRIAFQEHLLPKGELDYRGRARRPFGNPQDDIADSGRREGRHLRGRPDGGRARSLLEAAALSQEAPYAGRRRALWRLLRLALEQPDLSAAAQRDLAERLSAVARAALS